MSLPIKNTIEVHVSNVFARLRQAYDGNKRVVVLEGSARSTKTWSILQQWVMLSIQQPGSIRHAYRLKRVWAVASIKPDLFAVLRTFGLPTDDAWNDSKAIYTFANGSEIHLLGIDEGQKGRDGRKAGQKMQGKAPDDVWFEEAMEAPYEAYAQAIIRTKRMVILSFNPTAMEHWIFERVMSRDDAVHIHSTYLDNPFLDVRIRHEIERLEPTAYNIAQGTADEYSWKVFGLGKRCVPKGLIFSNVRYVSSMPAASECRRRGYGMDFGFTNDPSVVIDCALAHGELWFDELVYERGLTNTTPQDHADQPSIDGRLRDAGGDRGRTIWADSAEPKSIRDLVLAGWTVKAAEKGADSILYGINLLRKYPISITERSVNLIKDFQNYKWATDANGNPMNQPVSAWDHGPDAVRYWAMMEMEGAARPESFRLAVPAPRPWTI